MFICKVVRVRVPIYIAAIAIVSILAGTSVAEDNGAPVTVKPAAETVSSAGRLSAIPPAQPDRITGEYIKGYLTDSGKMLASPVTWSGSDWLKAGLVIGTASGLYLADTEIRNFAQRNQSSISDKGAAIGNALGNPFYILPPLGLFYLYGNLYDDPKARRASLLAVESLAISGVFTIIIKQATQRSRPSSGESSTTWNGPSFKINDTSFPSNHATAAFSVATVFAEEYGNNPYVPPIAYGLATLTGLARIYDNKHWASDAFFGAALGYFVGKAVVSYHKVQGNSDLKILPTVSQQGFGMMAEYRF